MSRRTFITPEMRQAISVDRRGSLVVASDFNVSASSVDSIRREWQRRNTTVYNLHDPESRAQLIRDKHMQSK